MYDFKADDRAIVQSEAYLQKRPVNGLWKN